MKPNPSLREFLMGSAVVAMFSLVGLGPVAKAQAHLAFDAPVTIPPSDGGTVVSGGREYSLSLQNATMKFFKGFPTDKLRINGSYLGHVLRMRAGETVRFNVTIPLLLQNPKILVRYYAEVV